MKKTILASAILLAGAANAAEIYNNEGTSVSLNGSFRGVIAIEDKDNVEFEDAGSRFDIAATKELEDGVKAYGKLEVKRYGSAKPAKGQSEDGLYFNKSYVGLSHGAYGALELGKQYGLNDALYFYDISWAHGNAYLEDNDTLGNDSNDQLKYTKAFGDLKVVASFMDQDTYAFGGLYEAAGLALGATYNIANDNGTDKDDNSNYVLAASYTVDALYVGGQFTVSDVADEDITSYGIAASYSMGQATLYTTFDSTEYDDDSSEDNTEIVAGASYTLAKGVITFAEFSSTDVDGSDRDEALNIGARYYF